MSSRKKLTISLVSVALVIVAAVVAVVAVLAAQNQTIKSGFTITYQASKNVVADVSAKYQLMKPQTGAVSGFVGTEIGSGLSIDRLDKGTAEKDLGSVSSVVYGKEGGVASGDQNDELTSLIFEFKFNNRSSHAYKGTLHLYNSTTTTAYTVANTLKTEMNLVATYWNGSTWANFLNVNDILTVNGLANPDANPSTTEKTVYVQLQIANPDFDVNGGAATAFEFKWVLSVV